MESGLVLAVGVKVRTSKPAWATESDAGFAPLRRALRRVRGRVRVSP